MVGMLAGSLQIPVSKVLRVALISSSHPSPNALPWGSGVREFCNPVHVSLSLSDVSRVSLLMEADIRRH